MKELLLAVKLVCCKKTVVVPSDFIYMLDFVKTFNNSINRNQVHLMFWSQDKKKKPNFDLNISNQFNYSTDACFNVTISKAFGKIHKVDCSDVIYF